jgi:predicted aspartyl protease
MRRLRPRRAHALLLASLAVGALSVSSCGTAPPPAAIHVEPIVTFALPPTAAGCGGATPLIAGAQRLPITVSTVSGQVAELVNVCIKGQGPYPFVIDTGAGESIIDAHLAARLHLAHDGQANQFEGVGCTGNAQPVAVTSWSVDGVALDGQSLTAATLPDFGTKGEPVGLLGSDVLSRFGAVRIDFGAQTLTLGGVEGPAATEQPVLQGPVGPPPPAILTGGQTGTTIPASVVRSPGVIAVSIRLHFGSGAARTFVVDTGSSQTVVDNAVAKAAHLASTHLEQRQTTVCSTITVPLVHSGPWSAPGVTLRPQLLGSANFGPISADSSVEGLLGSDQLKHFGWVIFDYAGGRIVLG